MNHITNSKYPLLSVVILTWNRKNDLKYTLNKVFEQDYPNFEVVVVDNGSKDETVDMIKKEFPKIKLIVLPDNTGIYGINVGCANTKGKYIIIQDNDAFPIENNTYSKIVEEFEKNENLAIISCLVINYFSKDIENIPLVVRGSIKANGINNYINYPYMNFHGAGVGWRKSIVEKFGYYDKKLFLYANEMDLAARILNGGYELKYFSNIRFYHKHSTKARISRNIIKYMQINLIGWANKYLPFIKRLNFSFGCFLDNYYGKVKNNKKENLLPWFYYGLIALVKLFMPRKRTLLNKNILEKYKPLVDSMNLTTRIKNKLLNK